MKNSTENNTQPAAQTAAPAVKIYLKKGIACTLIGGICWGFSGACGQHLFQDGALTANTLACIRMSASGLILLLLSALQPDTRAGLFAPFKTGRDTLLLLVFAFIGVAACQLTYFETIERSNAGTATVIQYLSPVMIVAGTALYTRRMPGWPKTAAVLLALTGIWLLATHGHGNSLVLSASALAWGILSAAAYALSSVLPGKLFKKFGVLTTLGWSMVIGAVPLFLLFRPWRFFAQIPQGEIIYVVLIVLVGTVGAYYFYMSGVNLLGPETANILACIEPVSATFFSVVWLKTPLVPVDYAGMALILAAIVVLSVKHS